MAIVLGRGFRKGDGRRPWKGDGRRGAHVIVEGDGRGRGEDLAGGWGGGFDSATRRRNGDAVSEV